jgi:hypothetical protein
MEAFTLGLLGDNNGQRLHEDVSRLSTALHDLSRAAHELPEAQIRTIEQLREDTFDLLEHRLNRLVLKISLMVAGLVAFSFACLYLYRRAVLRLVPPPGAHDPGGS